MIIYVIFIFIPSRNFVKLNVYYEDLNYQIIEEVAATEVGS